MTDKQIIIDDQKETIHRLQQECTEKTNAIIALGEQLKAKEQECEELKEEIKTNGFGCFNIEMSEQLDKLKAENDTLRKFLSKEPLALQALQSAYSSYKKSTDVFYEMVEQYKQTLTEIKEIAENSCCLQPTSTCEEYKSCNECSRTSDDITVKQILQKISEVRDDKSNR